jgi:hypothetical protein
VKKRRNKLGEIYHLHLSLVDFALIGTFAATIVVGLGMMGYSLWDSRHCWHPTGSEQLRPRNGHCRKEFDRYVERECCRTGHKRWFLYNFGM